MRVRGTRGVLVASERFADRGAFGIEVLESLPTMEVVPLEISFEDVLFFRLFAVEGYEDPRRGVPLIAYSEQHVELKAKAAMAMYQGKT